MPKHLYVFLVLTFLMGMLGGVYIYFLTRSPESGRATSPVKGYEIVATTYGGCERIGCRSLHILGDGSYAYLVNGVDDTYSKYEDTLTSQQLSKLRTLIQNTDLDSLEATPFEGTCPITYDGIAYRYEITYKGKTHTLDSCVVSLDEIPLFDELAQYFDMMGAQYDSHDLF